MSGKPPFLPQEREYSCAPACLRMVTACAGVRRSEDDIAYESECRYEGTSPRKLVEAAIAFGFAGTIQVRPSVSGLRSYIEQGLYPIAFIATPEKHAVIITEISETTVQMHDPAVGPDLSVPLETFLVQFELNQRLTIIVRP